MYIGVADRLTDENINRLAAFKPDIVVEQGDGWRVVQIYEWFVRQERDGESWKSPLVQLPSRKDGQLGIPLYPVACFAGSDYVQP